MKKYLVERLRPRRPRPRYAREGTEFRSLLRSRPVQVILGATLVTQTVAVTAATRGTGADDAPLSPALFAAAEATLPSAATPALRAAASRTDAESSALELAGKYREKGYRLTDALARQIYAAATAHDVDPEIAFGLVAVESSFHRTARSHVGATGLAQLMPATARWLEPGTTRRQLEDPETNLRLGFRYLRQMLDKYDGDTKLALLAYNRGPGTVDRVLRRGGNPDNGYPRKVMGN